MKRKQLKYGLLLSVLALFLPTQGAAETFYITQNFAAGTPWTDTRYYTTTEGTTTSAGVVPTTGDTLYIRSYNGGNRALRSPEIKSGQAQMLADVKLETGGELNLKSAANGVDIYMPSLELAGGTVNHGMGGLTLNLSGAITARAGTTSKFSAYQDNDNTRMLNIIPTFPAPGRFS